MQARKPTGAETAFLLAFHAAVSGSFLVAYLTGDEDTYGLHIVAGYSVAAALAARLLAALLAPAGSPLRLPRPALAPTLGYLWRLVAGDGAARRQRSPLLAWMAAALLVGVTLAALSGVAADFVVRLEDLHEALAEAALWIVVAHVVLVLFLHGLKRLGAAPRPANPAPGVEGAPAR